MTIKDIKVLNILAACGLIFLLLVCMYSFLLPDQKFHITIVIISTILQFLLGIIITIYAIKYTKKAYHLFVGLLLAIWGIMLFGMNVSSTYTLTVLWPIFGVVTGLLIFVAGLYKYRKIKIGFFIPSLVIFFLCLFYSLFSFQIIKIPFKKIVAVAGPFFMIMVVAILVLYFFIQQKNKNLVIDDEEDAFSEEEISSHFID